MEDNKKEIRNTSHGVIMDEEKRTVEGYAVLHGVSSDGLSFEEVIERGALSGVIAKSDVFALLNHERNRGVLARSKKGTGSLTLELNDKGLLYRFEAPKTALGDELLEGIRRGDIDSSSFAFIVGEDNWEKKSDGTWKRSIKRIDEIFDVSPVYNAAYSTTTVYTRGKEEVENREAEEQRKADLSAYYENLDKSLTL